MTLSNEAIGFLLVLGAGISTWIGGAVVFSQKLVGLANRRFLAAALAGSAGVMLYVSMVEIFVKSIDGFAQSKQVHGDADPRLYATLSFFGGFLINATLDKLGTSEPAHIDQPITELSSFAG